MALATARQFKPDLILLDVVMPDIDGGEVASTIMADEEIKNTPIVFLTAAVGEDEEGVISGYPFMAKPVNSDDMIERIEKHLMKSVA